MNIDMNFHSACVYLEMARDKFDRKEYASALEALTKAYSHNRTLIEQVYKLSVESPPAGVSAGEDSV